MPRSLAQVEDLRAAARAANHHGRPARGGRIVRQALRLLDDLSRRGSVPEADEARARARLLITLAFSEFEMHGLARARPVLADAIDAGARCDRLDVAASVHDLRGLVLVRSGDLEASLREFDAAIALAGHLDPVDRPHLFLNRGSVQLLRRDIAAARVDLQRCVTLSTGLGLTRVEFKARHNLGYAEYLAGNLPVALDAFARADALDVDVSRSVWLLDRARVLMEAGLLAEAEESLAAATRLLLAERANQDLAETQLARAECALLQGNWDLAKAHASRARAAFRRRQSVGWQARADLTRWQAYLDSPGGPRRVLREIGAAQEPDGPEVLLIAAEAHLALGQVAHAVELLERLGPAGRRDSLSARLHQHLVRAGVARGARDLVTARRELRTGLTLLARHQARYPSIDLRTAMAVHGGRLAELDLRVALESRSAATAFDSLERWRAMSHRRTAVTPPSDPELAELLSQLRMAAEDVRTAHPGAPVDRERRRQQSLERAVREREWRLQGDGRSERSARLTDLRGPIADRGTDVVSYFVLDGDLGAVTVSGGRPRVHTLAAWSDVASSVARVRADLDALSGRLLPVPLRNAITSSLRRDLAHLDSLLLPPAVAAARPLLVVPSRNLATLPWGLLPRRRGRPTTVTVSMTAWLRGLSRPIPTEPAKAIALAGPAVPDADREVAAVAALWPGARAIPADRSTSTALATGLGDHDLVHIAAHGTHNHDNPLFSSLRLGDGPLYAYDVPQDRPIAEHVILSSCDLGLATPRPGGEVLGLTAALLHLGAQCVVSSVARVGDHTAYATMVRYHERLVRGDDSATALATAAEDDLEQPAPFVCFGTPWTAG